MKAPVLANILEAYKRIEPYIIKTPLVRFYSEKSPHEIYLKPEVLQPIGSYKIRGAANKILSIPKENLRQGVYTASAGNMAQGVAWMAKSLGITCKVIVPDHAPQAKLVAIEKLGATYTKVPFKRWWQVLIEHGYPGMPGVFIHPVVDPVVIAGNGSMGLEIIADLPEVDAVIIPYGGGGMSTGIATAVKSKKPDVKIIAAEVETAAPLYAAFDAGQPVTVDYSPSFVDGIGSSGIIPDMWPHVSRLIDEVCLVSLDEIAGSIRMLMMQKKLIAEGAGAASLAAALKMDGPPQKIVCIVSGGSINAGHLMTILEGGTP